MSFLARTILPQFSSCYCLITEEMQEEKNSRRIVWLEREKVFWKLIFWWFLELASDLPRSNVSFRVFELLLFDQRGNARREAFEENSFTWKWRDFSKVNIRSRGKKVFVNSREDSATREVILLNSSAIKQLRSGYRVKRHMHRDLTLISLEWLVRGSRECFVGVGRSVGNGWYYL